MIGGLRKTVAAELCEIEVEIGTNLWGYELIARKYETLGPEKVDSLYVPSPTERLHTGWDGAVINAEAVITGLKQLPNNPLATFIRAR